jgi:hypothetical protein
MLRTTLYLVCWYFAFIAIHPPILTWTWNVELQIFAFLMVSNQDNFLMHQEASQVRLLSLDLLL